MASRYKILLHNQHSEVNDNYKILSENSVKILFGNQYKTQNNFRIKFIFSLITILQNS